jgi:hypothetical protein
VVEEIWKSAPFPDSEIDCVGGAALSVSVSNPVLRPVAVGEKMMLIEQVEPAARVAPQLLDCEKSPVGTMLEIVKVAPPVLVSVTSCAWLDEFSSWLPNVSEFTDRLGTGVGLPTPDKVMV